MQKLLTTSTTKKSANRTFRSGGLWCWSSVNISRIICGLITSTTSRLMHIWWPSWLCWTRNSANVSMLGQCSIRILPNLQTFFNKSSKHVFGKNHWQRLDTSESRLHCFCFWTIVLTVSRFHFVAIKRSGWSHCQCGRACSLVRTLFFC